MATRHSNLVPVSANGLTATNDPDPILLDDATIRELNWYHKHLHSNLVAMSTRSSIMSKALVVEALGFLVKWVRSFYILSRGEILIDFVPKGTLDMQFPFIKEVLEKKSGYHNHQGRLITNCCTLARSKFDLCVMYDYASLLAKGKTVHHVLHLSCMFNLEKSYQTSIKCSH